MASSFTIADPADQRTTVAEYTADDPAAVGVICERAAAAAQVWGKKPGPQRAAVLHRAAALVDERAEQIAARVVAEEGKLYSDALAETQRAAVVLRFHAGESERIGGTVHDAGDPATLAYTRRRPLGVVALITPWNFPIAIPAWKAAPALAAGNAIVLKPSSRAPGAVLELAEVLREAGVPADAVGVVLGGRESTEALADDPHVRGISFTGSNAVGESLSTRAAARGVRFQGELGGNNPLIVLADADVGAAARLAASGAFGAAGQKCTATRRVIVEAPVHDAFLAAFAEQARALRLGAGSDPDATMPPLVDRVAADEVLGAIREATAAGAEVVVGGGAPVGELAHGAFVEPTVLTGLRAGTAIVDDEVFGPVCGVFKAQDLDEAVTLANATPYGLSASVCTNNLAHAFTFVEASDAGMVHVNRPTPGADPHMPFGGVKASSGSGWREQGQAAVDFFTEGQTVYVNHGSAA